MTPLPTTGSVRINAGELPQDGHQGRFRVDDAEYRPDDRFGPQYKLATSMLNEEYEGVLATAWPRLSQPRLALVRDLRSKGVSEKAIEETIDEKAQKAPELFGYNKEIDEPQPPRVSRSDKALAYKLIVAMCGGSHKAAGQVINDLDSFEELAEWFKGKTFVAHVKIKTRPGDNGEQKKFVNIDGEREVYADLDADVGIDVGAEEDFENIPF